MAARRVRDESPSSRGGLERLDRVVVVVVSACASVALLICIGRFAMTVDSHWLLRGLTPALIAGIGAYQLLRRKPRADIVLAAAAVLIVGYLRFVATGYNAGATIGLVTVGMTGALFVARRVALYVAVFAALLLTTPFLWVGEDLTPVERLFEGIAPVLVYVFATWLLLWLRREFEAGETKYRNLARSKDEFVASISHELRTPLTAVVGLAHELRDRHCEFDREQVAEFIDIIAEQSAEVAAIVEDLLVVARDDTSRMALDLRPIDIRAEVASVAGGATIGMEIDVERNVPATLADPMRARQILRNLVANAQRYGGARVRVLMRWKGRSTIVEVRDDGPPIPESERQSIFDPYYRARQPHGVTASVGLGLTVSRQLARAMGGDVTYRHDGEESVFELRLPNARIRAPVATPQLQTTP